MVWEATDYFARSWNAGKDKPLTDLIDETRGFLEKNYVITQKAEPVLFDGEYEDILEMDEKEISIFGKRLDFCQHNLEKKTDPKIWRLSNVVRKEVHDCFVIHLNGLKPADKVNMTLAELMVQSKKMESADPFMIYHALHRQRRERVKVEANWADQRDSVNLIIDPVAATESQGRILSITSNEWNKPYPSEMELYSGFDNGQMNLFSLNNSTIVKFDENVAKVERKLAELGFVPGSDGVFVKGTLRLRLRDEGSRQSAASVHLNEKNLDLILDERFDLVFRATDIAEATNYGPVAVGMRNGVRNSQMLPDFVNLLYGIKDEIPFALSHKFGAGRATVRHVPASHEEKTLDQTA
jgi:hypothetical protein